MCRPRVADAAGCRVRAAVLVGAVGQHRVRLCLAPRREAGGQASSDRARIAAASRAALSALPMATVATGMPRGIWTIDSSESRPPRCLVGMGTPITGSAVLAASMPGQVRGAAGARDEHPHAAARGRLGVPEQVVGGAVCGHDPQLGRDLELAEDPQRQLQDGEVRAAAADDAHDRRRRRAPVARGAARVMVRVVIDREPMVRTRRSHAQLWAVRDDPCRSGAACRRCATRPRGP